jgi:hypothetical protein
MGANRITGLADGIASTDATTVSQLTTAGATYLLKASNLSDVANATTARGNLTAAKSGANSDITSLTGLTTPLSVAQGGTGVTASTGSGNNVLSTSPTLVTPILGTPTSGTLTNCTGLPTSGIAAIAWTSYTPTVTAGSGTFTTASASGQYQVIGKTCIASVTVDITTVGTATGFVGATLPFTSAARIQISGYGMEVNATGNMLKGYIPTSSTQLQITTFNNSSPIGAGYSLILTIVYEIA